MKKILAFLQAHFAATHGTTTGTVNLPDLVRAIITGLLAALALFGFGSVDAFVTYFAGFAVPYFTSGISAKAGFVFAGALLLDLIRRFAQHNPAVIDPTPTPTPTPTPVSA